MEQIPAKRKISDANLSPIQILFKKLKGMEKRQSNMEKRQSSLELDLEQLKSPSTVITILHS